MTTYTNVGRNNLKWARMPYTDDGGCLAAVMQQQNTSCPKQLALVLAACAYAGPVLQSWAKTAIFTC